MTYQKAAGRGIFSPFPLLLHNSTIMYRLRHNAYFEFSSSAAWTSYGPSSVSGPFRPCALFPSSPFLVGWPGLGDALPPKCLCQREIRLVLAPVITDQVTITFVRGHSRSLLSFSPTAAAVYTVRPAQGGLGALEC